jgi:hypothetical protein
MNKLLIAVASAGALLTAGAASAQTYYHHDRDHRDWHDRGWHDRGWHGDWRWNHDRYHYGRAYYGHRVCTWRYGERVCW